MTGVAAGYISDPEREIIEATAQNQRIDGEGGLLLSQDQTRSSYRLVSGCLFSRGCLQFSQLMLTPSLFGQKTR